MVGVVGDGDWLLGFLQKAKDLILSIDLHETETGAVARRHRDAADGQVGLLLDVCPNHVAVVHFVNVVAGEDDHVAGIFLLNAVDILVDGVGGAFVPVLVDALLGRQDFDELL